MIKKDIQGVTFPKGFTASGVKAGIKKSGKLDVALIYTEKKQLLLVLLLKIKLLQLLYMFPKKLLLPKQLMLLLQMLAVLMHVLENKA